jgi:hypothetical protein
MCIITSGCALYSSGYIYFTSCSSCRQRTFNYELCIMNYELVNMCVASSDFSFAELSATHI